MNKIPAVAIKSRLGTPPIEVSFFPLRSGIYKYWRENNDPSTQLIAAAKHRCNLLWIKWCRNFSAVAIETIAGEIPLLNYQISLHFFAHCSHFIFSEPIKKMQKKHSLLLAELLPQNPTMPSKFKWWSSLFELPSESYDLWIQIIMMPE